jgi:predicted phage terminase large subunit-like protein
MEGRRIKTRPKRRVPTAQEKKFLAQGREELYFFTKYVLGYSRLDRAVHEPLCLLLQDLEKNRRQLVLMPRGHFKSTISSVAYPLWRLIRDPGLTIYLDSGNLALTKKFLQEIRAHIESGALDAYSPTGEPMHTFASKGGRKWTQTELHIDWKPASVAAPSIMAGSVDVTKTGFHFLLIIEDDLHTEINTQTREGIEKVINHHRELKPIEDVGAGCERLVVGTRWAFDDLYQLLEEQAGWPTYRKSVWIDKAREVPLFPTEFPVEKIRQIQLELGLDRFACQYENEPISSENAIFRPEWIKVYEGKAPPGTSYILLDPAWTDKRDGDRSAFVHVIVTNNNQIYVTEAIAGRFNPDKRLDILWEMACRHNPDVIGIESTSFQKSVKWEWDKRMRASGRWWVVKPLNADNATKNSKEIRIKGLAPIYANGDIFHAPGLVELEEELLHYPKTKHEDLIDALSYIQQLAFPGGMNRCFVPNEFQVQVRGEQKNSDIDNPRERLIFEEVFRDTATDWYEG